MKARFEKKVGDDVGSVLSLALAARTRERYSALAAVVALATLFVLGSSATMHAQTVSFIARRDFAVARFPRSVAVGDFDGDGNLDLAVANDIGVSVLLGNGDGTFRPAQTFSAGSNPASVAVGDFNGDGNLDLAVANDFGVSVLLGNGNGTFQAAQTFSAGSNPASVAVGDFKGDGKLDLAVANTFSNNVSVLINNTLQ